MSERKNKTLTKRINTTLTFTRKRKNNSLTFRPWCDLGEGTPSITDLTWNKESIGYLSYYKHGMWISDELALHMIKVMGLDLNLRRWNRRGKMIRFLKRVYLEGKNA